MNLGKLATLMGLLSILALPTLGMAQNNQQTNSNSAASMTAIVENAEQPNISGGADNRVPPPAKIAPLTGNSAVPLPPATNNEAMPLPTATNNEARPLPTAVNNKAMPLPTAVNKEATEIQNEIKPPFSINPETYYVKANDQEQWQKGFENLVEGFYGLYVSLNTAKINNTDKPIWFDDAISYINTEMQTEISKTFASDVEQKESHKNIIRNLFTGVIPIESIALNKDTYHVLVSNYTIGNNTIKQEWFSVPTHFITGDDIKSNKPKEAKKEVVSGENTKVYGAHPTDTDLELMRHNESSKVWDTKQKKRK